LDGMEFRVLHFFSKCLGDLPVVRFIARRMPSAMHAICKTQHAQSPWLTLHHVHDLKYFDESSRLSFIYAHR
jgi:hypothetical protein